MAEKDFDWNITTQFYASHFLSISMSESLTTHHNNNWTIRPVNRTANRPLSSWFRGAGSMQVPERWGQSKQNWTCRRVRVAPVWWGPHVGGWRRWWWEAGVRARSGSSPSEQVWTCPGSGQMPPPPPTPVNRQTDTTRLKSFVERVVINVVPFRLLKIQSTVTSFQEMLGSRSGSLHQI